MPEPSARPDTPATTEVARAHSALANFRRWHPEADDTAHVTALAEAKMAAAVERALADAPPLSPEVRDRLAALLFAVPTRTEARA